MFSKFPSYHINRVLLSTVLCAFTMTYTIPIQAVQFNLNTNQVVFMVKMEKLVEKLMKSEGKSIDKMIEHLVDIKTEIETSCNVKIDVDNFMDQVSGELKKKGQKAPKKQFESIKKKIKSRDKKNKDHARYIEDVMYIEGYEMNSLDEQIMSDNYFYENEAKHDKDGDKDDKEEIDIPPLLVYGVTISLCGLFLMCIPIPACRDWGSKMIVAGITACANSICAEKGKEKDKDEDKK